MPSKKRFFGGLVGANPLRSGSFQDPGSVARVSSNEGVVSIDSAGPETSTTTVVVLNDYSTKTETQFNASNAGADDDFGTNCALSGDGTIAVFGAPYEDGASNTLTNYGAAYVYENGTEVAILRASGQSSGFGYDVAISKDGSLIVVASPFAINGSYLESGKLYIFEKPAGGWGSATTEDYQISTNNTSANLGRHVRLTDNGDTIIATATLSSQGRVLVYNRGSAWSDRTGHNAQLSSSNWSSNDDFGYGLSISGDGSVIAVGAPREDTTQSDSGSVYIYHKPTNGWATATETHFIGSLNRSFNAMFGRSCSLNEDGTILAIGEYNYGSSAGRIHVREYNGSTWSHSGVLTGAGSNDYLGDSVCISRDGNTIAGGAPGDDIGKGALHIYFKPSSGWGNASHNYKLTTTNVTNNAYLGGSVNYPFTQPLALSNDGRKVLSAANQDDDGATDSGSGFLFTATGGTASTTTTTTQTTQWFWGGLRGRDALVEGAGAVGDDKSLRFDGSGDYLEWTPTVARGSNWTFSVWFKRAATGGVGSGLFHPILEADNSSNSDVIGIWEDKFYIGYFGATLDVTIADSLADTSWHHIVVSWTSGQSSIDAALKIYLDGTAKTISSGSIFPGGLITPSTVLNFANNVQNRIGGRTAGAAHWFDGQLAEVHFVDGTAYDASYFGETRGGVWVPKEVTGVTYGNNGFYLDFKGNDTGVTLLLDGSDPVTNLTGGATVSNPNSDVSTTTTDPGSHPYATNFLAFSSDNRQKLVITNDTKVAFGTDDWTFETWIYQDNSSTNETLFDMRATGTSVGGGLLFINSSNKLEFAYKVSTESSSKIVGTDTLTANYWHHVALTVNNNVVTIWLDGINQGTWDSTTNSFTPLANPGIGFESYTSSGNIEFDGYMTDIRITKGYARYSGSFTPPTSALTNTPEYLGDFGVDRTTDGAGVTLLLDGSSATTDSSSANIASNLIAASGVTATDTTSLVISHPYGSSAVDVLDFSNQTGGISHTSSSILPLLDPEDTQWTLEMWVRPESFPGVNSYDYLIAQATDGATGWSNGLEWILDWDATNIYFVGHNGNSNTSLLQANLSTYGITLNNWHHVAVVRDGSDTMLFLNGTKAATVTNQNAVKISGNRHLFIGTDPSGIYAFAFEGQMTDIRITRGIARYTDTFTPPTSALTNDNTWSGKPQNNFSVEGNITPDDQLLDAPNLRFANLDPNFRGGTTGEVLSEGNLKYYCPINNENYVAATESKTSGKWYFETLYDGSTNNTGQGIVGWTYNDISQATSSTTNPLDLNYGGMFGFQGWAKVDTAASTAVLQAPSANDVIGVAFDADTQRIWFSVQGSWVEGDPDTGTVATSYGALTSGKTYIPFIGHYSANSSRKTQAILNFGQDHTFAGQKSAFLTPYSDTNGVGEFYYQPPSGFLALADSYVVADALATTGVLSTSEMLQASL